MNKYSNKQGLVNINLGKVSSTSNEFKPRKMYVGVMNCEVLAVNPSSKQLEVIFGRKPESEPNYMSTDPQGKPFHNIQFILRGVSVGSGKNTVEIPADEQPIMRLYLPIYNEYYVGKSGSHLCIDSTGRYAYVSDKLFQKHELEDWMKELDPLASIGLAADYKPCLDGMQRLTEFTKKYLGVKDAVRNYDKRIFEPTPLKDRACEYADPERIAKGDISEVREAFEPLMKLNGTSSHQLIKVMVGCKTTQKGSLVQVVYADKFAFNSDMFVKPDAKKFPGMMYDFAKALADDASRDAPKHTNVNYSAGPAKAIQLATPEEPTYQAEPEPSGQSAEEELPF